MSPNEHQRLLASLPPGITPDIVHYNIATELLPLECIMLEPIPEVGNHTNVLAVALGGIEVSELDVEYIEIDALPGAHPAHATEVGYG